MKKLTNLEIKLIELGYNRPYNKCYYEKYYKETPIRIWVNNDNSAIECTIVGEECVHYVYKEQAVDLLSAFEQLDHDKEYLEKWIGII